MMPLSSIRPGWRAGLKPDLVISVSAWADENRLLNQRSASEPGRWRTSRTPYLRAIMDDLSTHSAVEMVTMMTGTQIGKTETGNNWVGYVVDNAPGPMLIVQPTDDMINRWSRQRLTPMLEDMPALAEKIKPARSRDSGNTSKAKEFDGGIMILSGANSAASLSSMPVKYLFLDEVDRYPYDVGDEGEPTVLAMKRTSNFPRRKILRVSTPTTKDLSRIEAAYLAGDRREYHIPCPHCEEKQVMEFKHLHWKKDEAGNHLPESAEYTCIHCGALIPEHHKTWMLENGEWITEGDENPRHHSYHLNSLYSPLGWLSWADIVDEFLAAKGQAIKLKQFTNTIEGLPFEEDGDKIDRHALADRAEDYPLRTVPMGALILTAGVDVQDNRLEIVTWAWNMRERWPIDYHVIFGSPAENATWQQLDDYLRAPFRHASGCELIIKAAAVDSGGHFTQQVYDFCRLRQQRHIIAVKGHTQRGKPILGRPSKTDISMRGKTVKNGAEVWMVGTDTAKSLIYSWLKVNDPAADGYIHFSRELSAEFYTQLTAEKLGTRYHKGFPVLEWTKPAGARNEVLDCTVYATAAFWLLGLNRWRPAQWRQLEEKIQPPTPDLFASAPSDTSEAPAEAAPTNPVKPVKAKARGRRRRPGNSRFNKSWGAYG